MQHLLLLVEVGDEVGPQLALEFQELAHSLLDLGAAGLQLPGSVRAGGLQPRTLLLLPSADRCLAGLGIGHTGVKDLLGTYTCLALQSVGLLPGLLDE